MEAMDYVITVYCTLIQHTVNGERTAFIPRFSNRRPHKALYNTASHSPVHAHVHTLGERRLAQGHLDVQLGDRTSNLPVTSQPALPPETHAVRYCNVTVSELGLNEATYYVMSGQCPIYVHTAYCGVPSV